MMFRAFLSYIDQEPIIDIFIGSVAKFYFVSYLLQAKRVFIP